MAAPRSDNVKEIILAKTSELMEETGLSSISLASIAEACGISKGTLYYHYKTKEDIFFDLIERHFREQEQELIAWMDDLSKDVSVNRLLMYVLDRNNYEGALRMQVLSSACFGNEDVRRKVLDITVVLVPDKNPAGQTMPKGSCPICGTKLRSDFIACPGCGILLRSRCRNCGKALENDWSFCPYCTQAVVKEIPAAQTEEAAPEEAAE